MTNERRLTPRYPVMLPCGIVHVRTAGFLRRPAELFHPAEITELSINGALLVVPGPSDDFDSNVGKKLTLRFKGMDGVIEIRHRHMEKHVLHLGVTFTEISDDTEHYLREILAQCESSSESFRMQWENDQRST